MNKQIQDNEQKIDKLEFNPDGKYHYPTYDEVNRWKPAGIAILVLILPTLGAWIWLALVYSITPPPRTNPDMTLHQIGNVIHNFYGLIALLICIGFSWLITRKPENQKSHANIIVLLTTIVLITLWIASIEFADSDCTFEFLCGFTP